MVRPASTDFYQNNRFQVIDPQGGNLDPVAGFSTASTPNVSINAVEYREGIYTWTRKFPGIPTVGDLVLNQGISRRGTPFFDWILRVINGGNRDYRSELIVQQFHITDEFGVVGTPTRITRCLEVFPTDVKPTGDFGGDDDAVQISEATFAVEEIQVEIKATTSTPLSN